MDYYQIAGFGFHMPGNTTDNYLGDIDHAISAKRKRSIPPKKAIEILKRYIRTNET